MAGELNDVDANDIARGGVDGAETSEPAESDVVAPSSSSNENMLGVFCDVGEDGGLL